MYMDNSLLQAVFGCAHRKTTFPLTPIRRGGIAARSNTEPKAQTYIACLDCGKELPYDWEDAENQALASCPPHSGVRRPPGFRLRSAS
jgi:hypothetical protein